jgi:acylphosphatase
MEKVHVFIAGIVQGVGYRYSTVSQAKSLGLKGWVRNLSDGRVEALTYGEPSEIEALLKWFWKGPPRSKVEDVVVVSRGPVSANETIPTQFEST